jgi:hypothetical protein
VKSWVVEGSLDGENWMEIDRKTGDQVLKDDGWFGLLMPPRWESDFTLSFAVSKPVEARFIRLTQTDEVPDPGDDLIFYSVEFFGTLYR